MNQWLVKCSDYIRGFIDIANIETPRYAFVIKNIDIVYPNNIMRSKITYLPVGCHRIFVNYTSNLNIKNICCKFKPEHAQIIVGINTLESCLDLSKKDQAEIYLKFIRSCSLSLITEERSEI